MSGRGREGGRKPFRGAQNKSLGQPVGKSGNVETKKSIVDYNYYLGSAKQASDYETTTEYLINYIKKTYDYGNDIGTALKNFEAVDINPWRPSMQASVATDAAIQALDLMQDRVRRVPKASQVLQSQSSQGICIALGAMY
jgi:hypothetical protein